MFRRPLNRLQLVLTNTNSGTKVEFIDALSKPNSRAQVATITDKEVIIAERTPLFRRSTDAQLAVMGQWVLMKGGFEAYKCLVRGSAFNPKVALAELATVAVIAAAVAPAYNELFEAYRKKQSKHW
jgi:hypothetical protein